MSLRHLRVAKILSQLTVEITTENLKENDQSKRNDGLLLLFLSETLKLNFFNRNPFLSTPLGYIR